jgi:hypothetical protein
LRIGDCAPRLARRNGTFATNGNEPTGDDPRKVAIGDFNGDGDIDIAVGNTLGRTVSIFFNNGNGTFVEVPYTDVFSPFDVRIGDPDEDGDLDLAVAEVTGWVALA